MTVKKTNSKPSVKNKKTTGQNDHTKKTKKTMPLPALALLGAGTQLAGGFLNAQQQQQQNQDSQIYSRQDYERRKQDNIEFWRMQNEYNSPSAQMQRFQAAGLNPNLIYGQGSGGGSGSIQAPSPSVPSFKASGIGDSVSAAGLAGINSIYDLEMKAAQTDNLKAQNGVIQQEELLKKAQILATLTGEERARFLLNFDRDLQPISAEHKKEQLRQTKVSTDLAINEDARRATQNAVSIQEAMERMLNLVDQRKTSAIERERIKEHIRQMQKDGTLKELEADLRKNGITPQSPEWLQAVGRVLSGTGFDLKSIGSGIWNLFR